MADQRERTSTRSHVRRGPSDAGLHYRLRCLLTPDDDGDHRWTPELLPAGVDGDEAATG